MKPSKIEHIGIAVKDLHASIPVFEKLLGTSCYAIEVVEDQLVKVAFFLVGETKIELLESIDPDGPIASFINTKGEGIHHIALAVEDTNRALIDAKENAIKLIDRSSRKGAENKNIGFLNPKSTNGILFEYCSNP